MFCRSKGRALSAIALWHEVVLFFPFPIQNVKVILFIVFDSDVLICVLYQKVNDFRETRCLLLCCSVLVD